MTDPVILQKQQSPPTLVLSTRAFSCKGNKLSKETLPASVSMQTGKYGGEGPKLFKRMRETRAVSGGIVECRIGLHLGKLKEFRAKFSACRNVFCDSLCHLSQRTCSQLAPCDRLKATGWNLIASCFGRRPDIAIRRGTPRLHCFSPHFYDLNGTQEACSEHVNPMIPTAKLLQLCFQKQLSFST